MNGCLHRLQWWSWFCRTLQCWTMARDRNQKLIKKSRAIINSPDNLAIVPRHVWEKVMYYYFVISYGDYGFNLRRLFYFKRRSNHWVLLNHSRSAETVWLSLSCSSVQIPANRSTVLSFHLSEHVQRKMMLVSSWPCSHPKRKKKSKYKQYFLERWSENWNDSLFSSTNLSGFPFSILGNMLLLNTNCTNTSFLDSVKETIIASLTNSWNCGSVNFLIALYWGLSKFRVPSTFSSVYSGSATRPSQTTLSTICIRLRII